MSRNGKRSVKPVTISATEEGEQRIRVANSAHDRRTRRRFVAVRSGARDARH